MNASVIMLVRIEATSSRTSKTDSIESGLTETFASRIEAEAFEGHWQGVATRPAPHACALERSFYALCGRSSLDTTDTMCTRTGHRAVRSHCVGLGQSGRATTP